MIITNDSIKNKMDSMGITEVEDSIEKGRKQLTDSFGSQELVNNYLCRIKHELKARIFKTSNQLHQFQIYLAACHACLLFQ